MKEDLIKAVKFDELGLVPAVIQEEGTHQVLMLAYMNAESLSLSLDTGYTHFWSRSRGRLWKKGETSGHLQKITDIRYDCDADTLLVTVEQIGPACHTGAKSCFFNRLGRFPAAREQAAEPGVVLRELEAVILERKANPRSDSYTSRLFEVGPKLIRNKVLEESQEAAEASAAGDARQLIYEVADMLYHMLVLLAAHDVSVGDVARELQRRAGNPPKKEQGPRRGEKG
jgi:phosphoribosyl-ATP pyrophosphohydrolase/phosphoribosyl-AMP cyclohydrolase